MLVVEAKDKQIVELSKTVQDQSEAIARSSELISELNERLERIEAMARPAVK